MYRKITTDFWCDAKVEKLYSTAKYVLLYLLTSPRTNLAGCYEVTYTNIARDTGLKAEQVGKAIAELCHTHVISYCEPTGEVLIRNWQRYNWGKSPKVRENVSKGIERIKCDEFRAYLVDVYESTFGVKYDGRKNRYSMDTVSIQYQGEENTKPQVKYSMDTVSIEYPYSSVSVSVSDREVDSLEESTRKSSQVGTGTVEEIVSYLNERTGSSFKPTTKATRDSIGARLSEGYTVDDFRAVIDCKAAEWRNDPKMSRYLQPSTLFRPTNFENYLNQARRKEGSDGRYAKYR